MNNWLETVKKDKLFAAEADKKLIEFRRESLAGKAQAGEILFVQQQAGTKAMQIMAEDIYQLTENNDELIIENGGLKNQLGTLLNEAELDHYCKTEKLKLGESDDRNNRIIQRLTNRLESSKKLTSTDKKLLHLSNVH